MIATLTASVPFWGWATFIVFVLFLLALDLGILHRKNHEVGVKEALGWTAVWVSLALFFNLGVWYFFGKQKAIEFLTGYLIEYSLSVDNLFVFLTLFTYFHVPKIYQHRVLFWGIIGALLMRGAMIGAGAVLIQRFHWIIYLFGAFLVFTGIKMLTKEDEKLEPERNPIVRLFRKFFPVTTEYRGEHFWVYEQGRLWATPLFIVLICVEVTDLIFAVDSIPAIFAITPDPFIVFTSNVFAILGLRSLYFALSSIMHFFHYLKYGLGIVLAFVGAKMLMSHYYPIDTLVSLGVVLSILTGSIIASFFHRPAPEAK